MTLNTPDDNGPIGTPIYDQTWPAAPHSATDTAKEEAKNVASDAKDAGQRVVGTTKDEAAKVVGEAKNQAKDLYLQASSELKDQAGIQQKRVAEGLRSMSDELRSMAQGSEQNGVASELVRNLGGRADSLARWLDSRDPGSVVGELRSYAARKPGTFIALAAGAGIVAGRLARSLSAAAKNESSNSDASQGIKADQPPARSENVDDFGLGYANAPFSAANGTASDFADSDSRHPGEQL